MKTTVLVLWTFVALLSPNLSHAEAAKHKVIVSFDGKGTAWPWDVGVLKAFYEKMDPSLIDEFIIVGSSSGSMLAAYFACHGISRETILEAEKVTETFPTSFLNEETSKKTFLLALGIPPEIALEPMKPLLAQTGRNCQLKIPLLVPAANLDVADGRIKDRPFSGAKGRSFDKGTYVLSEGEQARGKICTYFVNEPMAAILEKLDPKERLCDLRLIYNENDVQLMQEASISEPTYFPARFEPDMTKLRSLFPLARAREYAGGLFMNIPVQDVKRVLPEAYVLATGRASYERIQNRVILNWFGFPLNLTLLDQRWWVDEQIAVSREEWDKLYEKGITQKAQRERGYAAAMKCFTKKKPCVPKVFTRPKFFKDSAGGDMENLRHRGIKALLQEK